MKRRNILFGCILIIVFLAPTIPAQGTGADGDTGKIRIGAPVETSRSGAIFSLGASIRNLIGQESGPGGILALALLASVYGILHALGPGHQKTLVSGYLLADGGGVREAIRAAGLASLSHAASVIGLFAALAGIGSGLGMLDVVNASRVVTTIAGCLLIAFALAMVWRRATRFVAFVRGTGHHGPKCDCGCDGHGEKHANLTAAEGRRGVIPLLVSGSISPCPGAAIFLLLGFREGNPIAGIIAVIAISLGMWITLIAVGLITVSLRGAGLAGATRRDSRLAAGLPLLLGVVGSLAVLGFAVLMAIPY